MEADGYETDTEPMKGLELSAYPSSEQLLAWTGSGNAPYRDAAEQDSCKRQVSVHGSAGYSAATRLRETQYASLQFTLLVT